ncbi:MAG: hypothetical protein SWN10_10030 [Pseudomonadota bacterium]|nr:hypothetical protein [Pseudomonadota bacterium]
MFNDIDKNDSWENWAKALSIPTQTIMYSIGLSFELSNLQDSVNHPIVKKRLRDIYALLNSVRPWFESNKECWTWFVTKQLPAFSPLTPSEIVKRYQDRGINALYNWIEERKTGNFQ